jgi:hypothetical protein
MSVSAVRAARHAPALRHTRPALELGLAALVSGLIFGVALILPMPFWRAQPPAQDPSGSPPLAGLGWPGALLAIGFALALCVPYRPYLLAIRAASRASTRCILLLSAALALVALLIYPSFGSDLFVYLDYERLWAVYGANPLLAFPNLHPEDWAFRFVWIPQQPSPYGPLWPLLTWPIARVAGDNLWGWIAGYKLLSLTSYVTCCALIWVGVEPAQRRRSLVVFAWSPLVLFEILGKAHNDGLMAVSVLGAVCLARKNSASGMLWATAGMLVKLSGFAVAVSLLVSLLRIRAWRRLLLAWLVLTVATVMLYAPFWQGPATLAPVLFQTSRVVWSPGTLLIALLGGVVPHADLLARMLCAAAWLVVLVLVGRRGTGLSVDTALILLATLLLLTTAFFAHYLVPVVALAAIAGNRRLEVFTVALSIGALAAYAVELLAPAMPAGWIGSPGYQALGSLLTLGPGAATALVDQLRGPTRR